MTDQSPEPDPHVELLTSIRDELKKANDKPGEPDAADLTIEDVKKMTPSEIAELDQRLLHSVLQRGDQ